jgi:predicted Zn-dependent peptidase
MPLLERTLGTWTAGTVAVKPSLAAVTGFTARQIFLIDKPGAAQSQIRIGSVGVARSTPDYFAIDVMNTILGGSFSSRLNQNLREEHGYTYGASSVFDMRLTPGPFFVGAGVQTDKTVESLQEFFKELTAIRTPVPADELTRARNLEALGFPSAFETTTDMAAQLAELAIYGLPESFFQEYVPRIQAVTAEDLTRAATRYVTPDRFGVIVVGDLAKIEQPIRAANLGPVTVVPLTDILE